MKIRLEKPALNNLRVAKMKDLDGGFSNEKLCR